MILFVILCSLSGCVEEKHALLPGTTELQCMATSPFELPRFAQDPDYKVTRWGCRRKA
jgi:hypothetical protein